MKHYLIKESDQLTIMQFKPELEESLLQRYAGKIITCAYSIEGVIERYSALLNFMACNGSRHYQSGATAPDFFSSIEKRKTWYLDS